jgi:hypothetical protein
MDILVYLCIIKVRYFTVEVSGFQDPYIHIVYSVVILRDSRWSIICYYLKQNTKERLSFFKTIIITSAIFINWMHWNNDSSVNECYATYVIFLSFLDVCNFTIYYTWNLRVNMLIQ